MIFECLTLGPFEMNCYLLIDERTQQAAVVDPGDECPVIDKALAAHGARVELILLTHGHVDHIGAVAPLKARTGAPVLIHPADEPLLRDEWLCGAALFGIPFEPLRADRLIREGDDLQLGSIEMKVLETPGHTPGGVSFVLGDRVLTGDCLFREGLGRTDLPGGNLKQIIASIHKLARLDEQMAVYPGHGPSSSIAHEKHHNPVLQGLISA